MKTTCFMIMVFTSSLLATNVKSQVAKVSISIRNANVLNVLDAIESQTDYLFVYNKDEIDLSREINVEVKNQSVAVVLTGIFKELGIDYDMEGNNIMLMSKIANSQQQKSISGKVTDSSGSVLPGVSVVVKGTTNGTITDGNGNYSLSNVPENAIVQFSFVGMKGQEVAVGEKTIVNVTLEEETIGIDEVVAIGYGTVKKSDLTGSVTSLRKDDMNKGVTPIAVRLCFVIV